MANRADLWSGVGAGARKLRLGSLSLRPLGMDQPLGLDLGGRRVMGLRALSLRTLGLCRLLGLGTGTGVRTPGIRARARGVVWRRSLWSRPLLRRGLWMVPAGLRRALHSVVRGKPPLFPERERD